MDTQNADTVTFRDVWNKFCTLTNYVITLGDNPSREEIYMYEVTQNRFRAALKTYFANNPLTAFCAHEVKYPETAENKVFWLIKSDLFHIFFEMAQATAYNTDERQVPIVIYRKEYQTPEGKLLPIFVTEVLWHVYGYCVYIKPPEENPLEFCAEICPVDFIPDWAAERYATVDPAPQFH